MIAMLIQDVLEEAGATSFAFAATEQDAVALALAQVPAVITSDVRLLEGTGPRAVEQILRTIGEIPVIFITANPDSIEVDRSSTVVLTKPVSMLQVETAFREIASL